MTIQIPAGATWLFADTMKEIGQQGGYALGVYLLIALVAVTFC